MASEYQLTGENWVFRPADQSRIPFDPGNPDYLDYLAWLAGGGIPDPADPAVLAPQSLTRLEFRNRFTLDEKAAIYTAAEASVAIRVWLDDLAAAQEVVLSDPQTQAGVQALEAAGLIGPGRALEILAGG